MTLTMNDEEYPECWICGTKGPEVYYDDEDDRWYCPDCKPPDIEDGED